MTEDWENDDEQVNVKSNWDDEDQDVKESWDEEEEEIPDADVKPLATAVPKKKTLAQKIAERSEEEDRKQAELTKLRGDPFANETPEQTRERLAKTIMESDLENAKALFGDLAIANAVGGSSIDTMTPSSKPEFDEYVKALTKRFAGFESSPHYSHFVESLLRDMVVALSLEDTRRLSSGLTAMINEKVKASKDSKKKKPAKKNVRVESGMGDAYVEDDFDDFM